MSTTNDSTFPVWSGFVPGTNGQVQYSYVELSPSGTPIKSKSFTRGLVDPTKDIETLNEFSERPQTIWDLPKIPYTYLATYPSKTKAPKHKQIATIHITALQASMDEMNQNPYNDRDYRVDFRFINSKTIHSVRNITMKTSVKSSKAHSKQAYKFKFDTKFNQTFFRRLNIKLRSRVMDPTLMREKVYIDMLNSVGVPTQQGEWVRLFVNNEPIGLYLMVDDIAKSFVKQTVHGGDDKIERGSLIQMNAYNGDRADLEYKGPTSSSYNQLVAYVNKNLGSSPATDSLKELIVFMKDLRTFDPTSTLNPVQYFNSTRLELDGFLRNMVLEYLGGAFDNYWGSASNYFMYKNPTLGPDGGNWQWLPRDFDGTFGNGAPTSKLPTYKNNHDFTTEGDRPAVHKLIIQNKEINALFEQTIKDIVCTAFKTEAHKPRIEMYNKVLSLDAAWDIGLKRKSPGTHNGFTFEDFNNNLYGRTKDRTTGLLPWTEQMSALVASDLNFQILAGLVDRVPPPPKGKALWITTMVMTMIKSLRKTMERGGFKGRAG